MSRIAGTRPARPLGAWIDYAAIGVTVAVIGIAAASYGAVSPAGELPLLLGSFALACLALAKLAGGAGSRWLAGPIALLGGFAVLALGQAISLPSSIVATLSSTRLSRTSELLEESPAWLSLGYFPPATLHGLRLLLVGIAVFTSVALCCGGRRRAKTLLLGTFAVGVAESILALLQIATGAEGIYWTQLALGGVRSGSFVNHSNFSQFLNLTGGAGLGLLFVRLSEDRHRRSHARKKTGLDAFMKQHGWLVVGLALHAIAIATSLSRNGLLSMMIASLVVALLAGRQNRLGWRIWALAPIPVLLFIGAAAIGLDPIYDRLGTLESKDAYSDRWELGLATLRTGADHWLVGVGLDAYRFVFPGYDTTGVIAVAEQADNDYAQLVAETGIVGVLLVLGFLSATAYACYRPLASGEGPSRYALYGVVFGLVAVAVQSVTDFGQRVPAVFCVTAALCGLAWAIATRAGRGSFDVTRARSAIAAALFLFVAPLWGWATVETVTDYRAERWWSVAYQLGEQLRRPRSRFQPQDYIDLVAAAETAASLRPENVEYAYYLNAFRWQLVLGTSEATEEEIARSPEGKRIALQIADALAETRRQCATYGPPYTLEGKLRLLAGDSSGERLVRLGAELAPNDPEALYTAGLLEASTTGGRENALNVFERAVTLDGNRYSGVARVCVEVLHEIDFARELAAGDPARMLRLAEIATQAGIDGGVVAALRVEADELSERRVLDGVASANEVATLAARRATEGQLAEAARLYRHALAKRYDSLPWRLALCDVLIAQELYEQAEREARMALRIRPGDRNATRRLEEISLLIPATAERLPSGLE